MRPKSWRDRRSADHRHGQGKSRRAVVCFRSRACSRCRHDPRSRRRGGARRPSLRHAGDATLRRAGDHAGVFRVLQYDAKKSTCWCKRDPSGLEGVWLMSELDELYQEVILDHNKSPRNFRVMTNANRKAEGYNPLCGDHVTVFLRLEDGVIKDISFQGSGCAISKASASMMTAELKGKNEVDGARTCSTTCIKCSPGMRREHAVREAWESLRFFRVCANFPRGSNALAWPGTPCMPRSRATPSPPHGVMRWLSGKGGWRR